MTVSSRPLVPTALMDWVTAAQLLNWADIPHDPSYWRDRAGLPQPK